VILLAIIVASLAFTAGILRLERAAPRPHGTPICGECSYSLIGLIGRCDRCPECGTAFSDIPFAWSEAKRDWVALCTGCGLVVAALVVFVISILLLR